MNVFGWSPGFGFEVLGDVRVIELRLPEVRVLGFGGKGLGFGWMREQWNGGVAPVVVVVYPPMDSWLCMGQLLELDLLVLASLV